MDFADSKDTDQPGLLPMLVRVCCISCQVSTKPLLCSDLVDAQADLSHCCAHSKLLFEPHHEKTKVLVSDLVRHKPGCTATEDGLRLEILDLESRGIVLSM